MERKRHSLQTSWLENDCWSPSQLHRLDWSSWKNMHRFRKNLKLYLIHSPFSSEPLQFECWETWWAINSIFLLLLFKKKMIWLELIEMAKNWNLLVFLKGVASKRGGRRVGKLYTVTRPCTSSTQELPRIFQLQSITGKFPYLSSSTWHPTFWARRRRKHHAHVKPKIMTIWKGW